MNWKSKKYIFLLILDYCRKESKAKISNYNRGKKEIFKNSIIYHEKAAKT